MICLRRRVHPWTGMKTLTDPGKKAAVGTFTVSVRAIYFPSPNAWDTAGFFSPRIGNAIALRSI